MTREVFSQKYGMDGFEGYVDFFMENKNGNITTCLIYVGSDGNTKVSSKGMTNDEFFTKYGINPSLEEVARECCDDGKSVVSFGFNDNEVELNVLGWRGAVKYGIENF